jgi:tRNA-specific 2-thiouridylase
MKLLDFYENWHDDSVTISECPWLEDSNDAYWWPKKEFFQTVDLSEEYQEKIVDYMFSEYEKGVPKPDVLCNREIKFEVL